MQIWREKVIRETLQTRRINSLMYIHTIEVSYTGIQGAYNATLRKMVARVQLIMR